MLFVNTVEHGAAKGEVHHLLELCSKVFVIVSIHVAGIAVTVFVDDLEFFMAGNDGGYVWVVTAALFSLKGFAFLQNTRIGKFNVFTIFLDNKHIERVGDLHRAECIETVMIHRLFDVVEESAYTLIEAAYIATG